MEAGIVILCLLLSAFFSGMEIAFISSNKIYIGIEKRQDTFSSRLLARLTGRPSRFIVAMLLGNTLALVVYAFCMGKIILRWLHNAGIGFHHYAELLLQTFLSTLIVLVTSEFLPKVFFRVYANSLVKMLVFPAFFFYWLFGFVSRGIIKLADFILLHIFSSKGDQEAGFFSRAELGDYISQQLSAAEDDKKVDVEIQIFQNALEFSGVKARDIMTPRTEIAAVEIHDSVKELRDLFISTDYSKILVYQNSLDNILGYVHSFDLFRKPKSIKTVMIPAEFVPETMLIKDAMELLTRKRKSAAVVLDEYGGTSGMLTLEDIVEELFGEIEDEHDSEADLVEELHGDHNWTFSARLHLDYLNEKYKLDLPEAEAYTTIAGYIVDHLKHIPKQGAAFDIGNYHFKIAEATGKRVELVELSRRDGFV